MGLEGSLEHIESTLPFVTSIALAPSALSYGDYTMSWIQRLPLSRKSRALICYNGVLSMVSDRLAFEEVYFSNHDLGGLQWNDMRFMISRTPALYA